jgi:hypothetical protein
MAVPLLHCTVFCSAGFLAALIGLGPIAAGAKDAPGAGSGAPVATPNGGKSASHISSQGVANSNGPNAVDRAKGQGRSKQRKSQEGLAHGKSKATGQQ